ncbi:FtsP/CotA-like multicopper oxidase with cupredoxin domain [Methanolinea mesophila]|uniref:hypothetical protein n=1 Tax=Methanolinea mesophila TaxID=547055 RepID=UPI001AE25C4D|nr:hypothetical protein [Methanolinea mesophila]MBP1928333.1 FtsP/CotA-like multicopper oxidase with cupredoxin domain [Methanolinea mesophila]
MSDIRSEKKRGPQRGRRVRAGNTGVWFTLGVLCAIAIVSIGFVTASNDTDVSPAPTGIVNDTVLDPDSNTTELNATPTTEETTAVPTTQETTAILTTEETTVPPTPEEVLTAVPPVTDTLAAVTPSATLPDIPGVIRASTDPDSQFNLRTSQVVSQPERQAAADRFWELYNSVQPEGAPYQVLAQMDPGGIPHYFGPYPNYANSPMPRGPIANITIVSGGVNYSANTTINVTDFYQTGSGANITPVLINGTLTGATIVNGGVNYSAPLLTVVDPDGTGNGAEAAATIGGPFFGGIRKFIDSMPGIGPANQNSLGQYVIIAVPDTTTYPAGGNGYTSVPQVVITDPTGTNATATAAISGGKVTTVTVTDGGSGYSDDPFVSFVGGGATVNAIGKANVTGGVIQDISLVGADYYEIELGEYIEQLHPDIPPTTLRGYRQTNSGDPAVDRFSYTGPTIIAQSDRPVRIKFTNNLPTNAGGDLFLPVDFTLMGAGMGPLEMNTSPGKPIYYTQNRAVIHLHGGVTPWISDGTPLQWITPAGENTDYPTGVSVRNVPDMPDPGDGAVTLYYTNQQSARLMFYHDHAHAITRLNVYAGMASPYLITDAVEQDLINGTDLTGVNPTHAAVLPDIGIPLVIQDKTFVDADTIAVQDPTWNWGTTPPVPRTGDLWWPHVYMPAANPYVVDGVNALGRWAYGPWFWPPTSTAYGPVANPYYGQAPWEGPMIPGTPNPSAVAEAFMDTPLVNGAVYPNLTVEPKAYRFRILNAADDRFFNLQMYVADPDVVTADGRINTEVKMVPAAVTPGWPADWPTDGRAGGVPDPTTIGPSWIQVGTEGGFLPAPVVVPNQPITWVVDPTLFTAGNVNLHSLFLGPAERADVIVDFSQYAGKTLILYNDAPAPTPALDPHYDYYTGNPDGTSYGSTPTTQAGYGPNTRTIMQINVAPGPVADPYDLSTLNAVFAKTSGKNGVFETDQDDIIIPDSRYNTAYDASFPADTYVRIFQTSTTFQTLMGQTVTLPLAPKSIQDEMGEAYDEYGRMSGLLGLQVAVNNQQNLLLYSYMSPPIDFINDTIYGTQIGELGDGTTIWKITHNGVDTHPLHWHLFNLQLINRVGWDGFIYPPDANELGWKETIKIHPLEDTIVAMRPIQMRLPFDLPNSIRPIAPTEPIGKQLIGAPGGLGFFDPQANPVTVFNHLVNFGNEYVFHCHILSHEEMDMMHSMPFVVPPQPPVNLTATEVNASAVNLTWTDDSLSETGFYVERSTNSSGPWTPIAALQSTTGPEKGGNVSYIDTTGIPGTDYYWRTLSANLVGDNFTYPAPSVGFPQIETNSTPSNVAQIGAAPVVVASMVGVWRPSNRNFYLRPTGYPTIPQITILMGSTGDIPISGDWNGDGLTEVGVWRPSNRNFYLRPADYPASPYIQFGMGLSTDIPISGDWNGDGITEVGVFRPSTHTFYLRPANNAGATTYTVITFGTNGDLPVTGDWDGDGRTEVGTYTPSTRYFHLRPANYPTTPEITFGMGSSTDLPISGDWNADGITEVGLFRPSTHIFYLRPANTAAATTYTTINYGQTNDKPVTGVWI